MYVANTRPSVLDSVAADAGHVAGPAGHPPPATPPAPPSSVHVSESALRSWLVGSPATLADEGAVAAATTLAVLEALSSSAFIVRSDGIVLLANTQGRADLDEGGLDLRRCLDRPEESDQLTVHYLPAGADGVRRVLVLRKAPEPSAIARMARARERWKLTPHQTEILRLLVHGEANKTVADRRGCSLRTVEVHVSALLEKSQTASRAELIARFWTLG